MYIFSLFNALYWVSLGSFSATTCLVNCNWWSFYSMLRFVSCYQNRMLYTLFKASDVGEGRAVKFITFIIIAFKHDFNIFNYSIRLLQFNHYQKVEGSKKGWGYETKLMVWKKRESRLGKERCRIESNWQELFGRLLSSKARERKREVSCT